MLLKACFEMAQLAHASPPRALASTRGLEPSTNCGRHRSLAQHLKGKLTCDERARGLYRGLCRRQ